MPTRLLHRKSGLLLAAGAFSPSDISGLQLWLDASRINGLNDGDPISTWTDVSGRGNNATASSTARALYKPGIQNGKPVVRFDGSNDRFDVPAISPATVSLFAVAKFNSTGSDQELFSANQVYRIVLFDSGTNVKARAAATGGNAFATDSVTAEGAFHVYLCHYDAAAVFIFTDGVQQGTSTTPTGNLNAVTTTMYIGINDNTVSNPMNGDIAEILLYDHALSAAERRKVTSYLGIKWGVAVA